MARRRRANPSRSMCATLRRKWIPSKKNRAGKIIRAGYCSGPKRRSKARIAMVRSLVKQLRNRRRK